MSTEDIYLELARVTEGLALLRSQLSAISNTTKAAIKRDATATEENSALLRIQILTHLADRGVEEAHAALYDKLGDRLQPDVARILGLPVQPVKDTLDELNLPAMPRNALRQAGLTTPAHIRQAEEAGTLRRVSGIGKGGYAAILKALAELEEAQA